MAKHEELEKEIEKSLNSYDDEGKKPNPMGQRRLPSFKKVRYVRMPKLLDELSIARRGKDGDAVGS